MPVYKHCPNCKRDHKLSVKKCSCGLPLIDTPDFRYRIKFKRGDKWKSKLLIQGVTLWDAEQVEAELIVQADEENQQKLTPNKSSQTPIPVESTITKPPLNSPKVDTNSLWEDYYRHAKLVKKTHRNDLCRWNKHVAGRDYMTTMGVTKILSDMQDKGLSPQTVRHMYNLIKRVHNWSREQGSDHPNPCASIKLPRVDNTLTDALPEEDAKRLVKYLRDPENETQNRRTALVTLLAVTTGRRRGEILGLLKRDVDLEMGMITCRNTKSNGRNFTWPINEIAREALVEAMEISKQEKWDTVFGYTGQGFQCNWERLRARLLKKGIISRKCRFHSLRHTYATLLVNGGTSLYVLQKLLGHSTIELTQRYSHLSDHTMREAVDSLNVL